MIKTVQSDVEPILFTSNMSVLTIAYGNFNRLKLSACISQVWKLLAR
jgi:hypothetical protein